MKSHLTIKVITRLNNNKNNIGKKENAFQCDYKRSLSTYIKVTLRHSAFYKDIDFNLVQLIIPI